MNHPSINPTPSDIRNLFDRIAPVYDQFNNGLSLGQHRVWKLMAVKWSESHPGDTCLDLCCGSGDLAQLLARQVAPGGQVYGVDFSPAQLAVAKARVENQYPPLAIRWVQADALELPFDNNYFEAATMGYGLRNVTDIPACLGELYRVLKPGAKAAILDFHRPSQGLVRAFQQWYLHNVVVARARAFGLTEEYAYIAPSLERFPKGQQQVELARQVGFTSATHYRIAGEMMGVLVAGK
ncbi:MULTISPECIES: bifunctional demethylmenaquinone methyltransferase/2-methoxy-6-polyprenyl-1,4-benzoquinol methylase UbiE [unclassified Coleofasciculus]|uniref:bifunctional demethylmenaquinone methyltransferase/2-methoxy-6-polyprenyl-1,4-benzoquinol methylase UbiE n=1 Tax=unclassified Coleofasciculus TaxID=2692782 RepID=UPI00187E7C1D|nr:MULTISPECIES: bifunctional demethylmenaquinone methyltransferase/2-methoxy-6-polyprenyl-1,4-benzoquinol methylase UbiE [unclassified Coleofasciculus]MBE9128401.1 bifunctional demethylmenaquinone methyltransferase/2-methoxy-6-polyprenyl-1,4-benzoquinol methylase UbiE [Coleofasciculus sp. LEGE 07081]MBE9150355.1 bifunctional demethylmenaquinone methyltransferase/2-methoxy-6-polyprenyl-1,4-benzoquinol methylase UbiE [Coleofasciculus sp. LEGE 07092]